MPNDNSTANTTTPVKTMQHTINRPCVKTQSPTRLRLPPSSSHTTPPLPRRSSTVSSPPPASYICLNRAVPILSFPRLRLPPSSPWRAAGETETTRVRARPRHALRVRRLEVPRGALHARQSDKQCWCFYFIGQCGNITDLQKRASEITAQKRACLREREEGRTLDAPNADEAKTNDASCTAPAVRASRCVVRITDTSVTNAMASPERSA